MFCCADISCAMVHQGTKHIIGFGKVAEIYKWKKKRTSVSCLGSLQRKLMILACWMLPIPNLNPNPYPCIATRWFFSSSLFSTISFWRTPDVSSSAVRNSRECSCLTLPILPPCALTLCLCWWCLKLTECADLCFHRKYGRGSHDWNTCCVLFSLLAFILRTSCFHVLDKFV